jgi:hypothetical protein
MSDVIFKEGINGPYAQCNVILCKYWTGSPAKIGKHMKNVHGRSEEQCSELVKEFVEFFLDNGGDPDNINIMTSDFEITENWKIFNSELIEKVLTLLNEYELED